MNTRKNANWINRAALLLSICSLPAAAATIAVPDGNFTSATNSGTLNGGLLGGLLAGSASNVAIGSSGPWVGNYTGVLGVLAAPTLAINSAPAGGSATISGIVQEVGVTPILDNTGSFSQTLTGTTYLANTTYTLDANVNVGQTLLGATVLSNSGVGIGLTNGGLLLANTLSPGNILSLTLLSNNTYTLALQFTTGGTAPTGDLGIRLFDTPTGLASGGLLNSVTFSNVTLDASPASAPEPASFAMMFGGMASLWFGRKRRLGRK